MADHSGFTAYKVGVPLDIVPGRQERSWMDDTNQRFAYRCLPLTIANSSGWEVLSPCTFEAVWDGGTGLDAIAIRALDGYPNLDRIVSSHFGEGVLTVHTGYLFRTNPGWAINVRGSPNYVTDGIQALEGIIETEWLQFTFTMNWLFTRPGSVVFEKGAPLAFLVPIEHKKLDVMKPKIVQISNDPDLASGFKQWADSRSEFNKALHTDTEVAKKGWQRNYHQGTGAPPNVHVTKRKLKKPVVVN
jgi:Family of unknown function (DUF6065)